MALLLKCYCQHFVTINRRGILTESQQELNGNNSGDFNTTYEEVDLTNVRESESSESVLSFAQTVGLESMEPGTSRNSGINLMVDVDQHGESSKTIGSYEEEIEMRPMYHKGTSAKVADCSEDGDGESCTQEGYQYPKSKLERMYSECTMENPVLPSSSEATMSPSDNVNDQIDGASEASDYQHAKRKLASYSKPIKRRKNLDVPSHPKPSSPEGQTGSPEQLTSREDSLEMAAGVTVSAPLELQSSPELDVVEEEEKWESSYQFPEIDLEFLNYGLQKREDNSDELTSATTTTTPPPTAKSQTSPASTAEDTKREATYQGSETEIFDSGDTKGEIKGNEGTIVPSSPSLPPRTPPSTSKRARPSTLPLLSTSPTLSSTTVPSSVNPISPESSPPPPPLPARKPSRTTQRPPSNSPAPQANVKGTSSSKTKPTASPTTPTLYAELNELERVDDDAEYQHLNPETD